MMALFCRFFSQCGKTKSSCTLSPQQICHLFSSHGSTIDVVPFSRVFFSVLTEQLFLDFVEVMKISFLIVTAVVDGNYMDYMESKLPKQPMKKMPDEEKWEIG